MPKPQIKSPAPSQPTVASYFALVVGIFLATAFLKWGNPVILDSKILPPTNLFEYFYQPWPLSWAYFLLIPLVFFGVYSALKGRGASRPSRPSDSDSLSPRQSGESIRDRGSLAFLIPILPLVWILWQFISASQTVDHRLTSITLPHLGVCALFFYLGFFGLKGERDPWALWAILTVGLFWVIKVGFEQHFGGLEQTLRYFKQQPGWENLPPELIKKMEKGRIFSTLCYPNTLAGALLLLLPISLAYFWKLGARFSRAAQIVLVALFGGAGLACLFWSESKAGWLVAVIVITVALWHAPLGGRWKRWFIGALIVAGLAGFSLKYASFFQKGATSVVARFDYWKAALENTKNHPLLGSGPGTFFVQYVKLKAPESEVARLCHNDYLQQASDSGIPGFLAFFGFIVVSLTRFYRLGFKDGDQFDLNKFAIWLGLLGLGLHSLVEFHLYVPALAWTEFLFLGWMWSRGNGKQEASCAYSE